MTLKSIVSLEVEIERAWLALGVIPARLYLTPENRIVARKGIANSVETWAYIGTYTHAVPLNDLRADVFWTLERRCERGNIL